MKGKLKMKSQMLKKSINKRSKTMRTYLYFFLLMSLFVIGCTEESSILSPVNTQNNAELISDEPNWIVNQETPNLTLKKDVSVSKMVYGNQETLLEINTGYAAATPHGYIQITANARFQRYSFSGSRYITMSINDKFGTATFSPSGTFSKPVIYNLTIMGVDLSKVDPAKVSFVYMAADGKYYKPKYQQIYVEKQSGKLQIDNVELPHFSRYGFVN
jgi:hypothetical protein